MAVVQFQQIFRQRRHQRAREDVGRQHGEHHRLGQRDEQKPRHAAQEKHREKHDADAERRDTSAGTAICEAPSRIASLRACPAPDYA